MAKRKILIVEDDHSLADVLAYNLRREGYDVYLAGDGQEALAQAQRAVPDLVILDLMLPVLSGTEVCRRLRADPRTRETMILMLTAKAEETDQIVGFSLGADDYVTKPFSVKVLIERLKALQRRREARASSADRVSCHGVTMDRSRHLASVAGRPIELTRAEFRLLDTLVRQPGRVFRRAELIGAALGEDTVVLERTIDVHIRSLRRKMDAAADLIETVRGIGYRFRDPAAEE